MARSALSLDGLLITILFILTGAMVAAGISVAPAPAPAPAPRLGAPFPGPLPPRRLGAPPRISPLPPSRKRVPPPIPSRKHVPPPIPSPKRVPPPIPPPQLGIPLPTPPLPSPRMGAPPRPPLLPPSGKGTPPPIPPPQLRVPLPTPPLPTPRLGAPPRPPLLPPSRKGTPPPIPPPQLGIPLPTPPLPAPRLGAPPRPSLLPPSRKGTPPPIPSLPPPQLGAPLLAPPLGSPQLGAPSRAPLLPPKKGTPTPAPTIPSPQLGAPLPAPPRSSAPLLPPPRKGVPPPTPKLGAPLLAPPLPPRLRVPPRAHHPPPSRKHVPPPVPIIRPPRSRAPLPAHPLPPSRKGAPPRAPRRPPFRKGAPPPAPQLGAPLPTPLPPPRVGAPPPTPRLSAPLPSPILPPPQQVNPPPAPLLPPPQQDNPPPAPLLPPPQTGAPPSGPPPVVGPGGPKIPALIAFGDSIVDTGNNNYLGTIVKANFPPYGKDYPGHKATGRFSDGKITVDFIASALGLKETLPPYLNKNLTLEELKTGVTFASAGSGYNNATCKTSSTMTIERQLELFTEYKAKVGTIPERALYIVCSGSNDIVEHFTLADGMSSPEYADMMAHRAIALVERLIGEGARQIALTGTPPVGCLPSQRRMAGGVKMQCATDRNQLALMFNRKLSQEAAKLSGRYRGVNIFYVDLYSILADVVQRYQHLGFKNGKDSCCGYVGLAVGPLCNMGSRLCPDPSQYVFWDSYHPTERAYKIMIDEFMRRYLRYIH